VLRTAALRRLARYRPQVECSERLCLMVGWRDRVPTEPAPVLVRSIQFRAPDLPLTTEATSIVNADLVAAGSSPGDVLGKAFQALRQQVPTAV